MGKLEEEELYEVPSPQRLGRSAEVVEHPDCENNLLRQTLEDMLDRALHEDVTSLRYV